MKDYFLTLLQHLDKLTGIRQYERLCQLPDFKNELNTLLDFLCRAADQFPFIPEEQKKQIINEAVIADPDFIGLNAKFVAKALNAKREFYLGRHEEPVISPDALTGEAREERLNEWLKQVNGMPIMQTASKARNEFARVKTIQPADGKSYTPQGRDLYEHARHIDYLRDNYDARTGDKLPTWISEEEYNKVYDEVNAPKTEEETKQP